LALWLVQLSSEPLSSCAVGEGETIWTLKEVVGLHATLAFSAEWAFYVVQEQELYQAHKPYDLPVQ